MPFKFFTGELEGVIWWSFGYWSRLMKSLCVQCTQCSPGKFKDSKKCDCEAFPKNFIKQDLESRVLVSLIQCALPLYKTRIGFGGFKIIFICKPC